ncbi:MAG: adenylosuccinate lyase family protein [Methylobacteriaceae bacterium]|nr:adenylosuccinate lyase family protein [Methylobacteriaceae bacterium]MBV9701496.1 adenylosuccinate lyase family protein [Methylobacteriaceae bacterium]
MTFCALDSELTGPLLATSDMQSVFSDRARIAAMLKVEAALARAEARLGLVPNGLAAAIEEIAADRLDLAALGRETASAGVPAIPFVKAVQAQLPKNLEHHFHKSVTSQDIIDTALVLQVADALDLVQRDLIATIDGLVALAQRHRTTPCVGRTYGQHAAPITFGYKAAVWLAGIVECAADLPRIRGHLLVASLGGPVGTLSGLGKDGVAVLEAFANELGLGVPVITWHTLRARMVEIGSWLAILIGALAKVATDVAHLASTEVGEVAEPHAPGRGASSAMPHKRNPISATVILAAHANAKGLIVTLLDAMAAGHERPAGPWHAEWNVLPQLFGFASGALREGRRIAEGLTVDAARMQANLDVTRGLLFADVLAARLSSRLGRETAHRLVEEAANETRRSGRPLSEVMAKTSAVPEDARHELDGAFDLGPAVAAAAGFVDRALADARQVRAQLSDQHRSR